MKICPTCHTKYTDDTLKFCLQDGKELDSVSDEKTLVFDKDSFANEETIAENIPVNTTEISSGSDENLTARNVVNANTSNDSVPTIKREAIEFTANSFENTPNPTTGGFSFLTGFLIGIAVIGVLGLGVLAVIFLPSVLNHASNANTSSSNSAKKEKIIADTDEVKTSSSSSRGSEDGNKYLPKLAFDGNSRTAWSEGASGPGIGEWIAFDFKEKVKLRKILIEPGYFKTKELWEKNNRLRVIDLKFSNGMTKEVTFPDEMKEQTIDAEGIKTESVMLTIKSIYPGRNDSKDTLVSEVKFVVEER